MGVVAYRQAKQAGTELEPRAPVREHARPGRVRLITAADGLHVGQAGLGSELLSVFEVTGHQQRTPLREQQTSGLFVQVQRGAERSGMGCPQLVSAPRARL